MLIKNQVKLHLGFIVSRNYLRDTLIPFSSTTSMVVVNNKNGRDMMSIIPTIVASANSKICNMVLV